jgi:multicomponent K+:H+ antiporter subunit D
LVADAVISRRGAGLGLLQASPVIRHNGLFAALFFGGAIAMAGMPPLSGFLGKLLILDAMRAPDTMVLVWVVILGGSLLTIVGFARAGSIIFWKSTAIDVPEVAAPMPAQPLAITAIFAALAMLGLLTVFAGPAMDYFDATSQQLYNPAGYISAVLGNGV